MGFGPVEGVAEGAELEGEFREHEAAQVAVVEDHGERRAPQAGGEEVLGGIGADFGLAVELAEVVGLALAGLLVFFAGLLEGAVVAAELAGDVEAGEFLLALGEGAGGLLVGGVVRGAAAHGGPSFTFFIGLGQVVAGDEVGRGAAQAAGAVLTVEDFGEQVGFSAAGEAVEEDPDFAERAVVAVESAVEVLFDEFAGSFDADGAWGWARGCGDFFERARAVAADLVGGEGGAAASQEQVVEAFEFGVPVGQGDGNAVAGGGLGELEAGDGDLGLFVPVGVEGLDELADFAALVELLEGGEEVAIGLGAG